MPISSINEIFRRTNRKLDPDIFCKDLYLSLQPYFSFPENAFDLDVMFTKFVNVVRSTTDRHAPLLRLSKKKAKLY